MLVHPVWSPGGVTVCFDFAVFLEPPAPIREDVFHRADPFKAVARSAIKALG